MTESHINVLLVEDHVLTRIGLKAALNRTSDIKVIGEAGTGEEAVSIAGQLKPDVILMDVGMPIMDGIQATKIILSTMPEIKVIMLTQHDDDTDILASLTAGASGYCLKDVQPERLYTAIRSVNSGDAWLDATIASRVLKYFTMLAGSPSPKAEAQQQVAPQRQAEASAQAKTKGAESAEDMDRPFAEALSAREIEVIKLIVDGLSNQEIANKLIISLATAKTHVRNILNKLAVDDRTQAAVHAMRRGLV